MKIRLRNLVIAIATSFLVASTFTLPATANGAGVCGPGNFAGGDGTQGNPYQIFDANSLSELRDCGAVDYKYYVLNNDITLSGLWNEINSFTGSIDGNNFTISNIDVASFSQYAGLFKLLNNVDIYDLNLSGNVSNSHWSTGLLAGAATDSTFINIQASVEITADSVTGGLIGEVYRSTVTDISVSPLTPDSEIGVSGGTAGGVFGITEDTQMSNIYSNIDVHGLSSAGYLGGISGIDRVVSESSKIQTNLTYEGDITSLYAGSGLCGGIIGAGDQEINGAFANAISVNCASSPVAGVVAYGTNSVSNSIVDAELVVADQNNQPDGVAGGIVGYWTTTRNDQYSFAGNTFEGSIDSAAISGGLVGFTVIDSINETSELNFTRNVVRADFQNGGGVGGFLGTLVYNGDNAPGENASLSLSESYSTSTFTNFSGTVDAAIYFLGFPIDIQSTVIENSIYPTNYGEVISRGNIGTMKKPAFWDNNGFNLVDVWGMSSSINDGLPVLRSQNELSQTNSCQVKAFPDVLFAKNSAKLSKQAKKQLNTFTTRLLNGHCLNIYIAGFASSKETVKGKNKRTYQNQISLKRLNTVYSYVNNKIAGSDVEFEATRNALGSAYLKNKDKTQKQQAANRRVEIGTIS